MYYLTPKGLTEKSRLTGKYLSSSFGFYRKASSAFSTIYEECELNGWRRVLLFGLSELTEIAFIRAQEYDIELLGIVDDEARLVKHLGLPVWSQITEAPSREVCLITSLHNTDAYYQDLTACADAGQIFLPDILGTNQEAKRVDEKRS